MPTAENISFYIPDERPSQQRFCVDFLAWGGTHPSRRYVLKGRGLAAILPPRHAPAPGTASACGLPMPPAFSFSERRPGVGSLGCSLPFEAEFSAKTEKNSADVQENKSMSCDGWHGKAALSVREQSAASPAQFEVLTRALCRPMFDLTPSAGTLLARTHTLDRRAE